jgi:hypothetical protein
LVPEGLSESFELKIVSGMLPVPIAPLTVFHSTIVLFSTRSLGKVGFKAFTFERLVLVFIIPLVAALTLSSAGTAAFATSRSVKCIPMLEVLL